MTFDEFIANKRLVSQEEGCSILEDGSYYYIVRGREVVENVDGVYRFTSNFANALREQSLYAIRDTFSATNFVR